MSAAVGSGGRVATNTSALVTIAYSDRDASFPVPSGHSGHQMEALWRRTDEGERRWLHCSCGVDVEEAR